MFKLIYTTMASKVFLFIKEMSINPIVFLMPFFCLLFG